MLRTNVFLGDVETIITHSDEILESRDLALRPNVAHHWWEELLSSSAWLPDLKPYI